MAWVANATVMVAKRVGITPGTEVFSHAANVTNVLRVKLLLTAPNTMKFQMAQVERTAFVKKNEINQDAKVATSREIVLCVVMELTYRVETALHAAAIK